MCDFWRSVRNIWCLWRIGNGRATVAKNVPSWLMVEKLSKVPLVVLVFLGYLRLRHHSWCMQVQQHCFRKNRTVGLIWTGAEKQPKPIKGDLRQMGLDLSRVFHNAVLFLKVSLPWSQMDPSEDLQHLHKHQAVNQEIFSTCSTSLTKNFWKVVCMLNCTMLLREGHTWNSQTGLVMVELGVQSRLHRGFIRHCQGWINYYAKSSHTIGYLPKWDFFWQLSNMENVSFYFLAQVCFLITRKWWVHLSGKLGKEQNMFVSSWMYHE